MVELFVERKLNEKTKNKYVALYADYGYRVAPVSFDVELMSELLECAPNKIHTLQVGQKLVVGTISKKADK